MSKKTLENRKLNLRIELDTKQVFPNDPGQGTPAMVYLRRGNRDIASSTYGCCTDVGTVMGYRGEPEEIALNTAQLEWLNQQENEIADFLKW